MEHSFSNEGVRVLLKHQYHSRRASGTLKRLASPTGVIVEGHILRSLREQGFDLDPIRDNKSVYHPQKVFDALAKYVNKPTLSVDEWTYKCAFELTMRAFGKRGDTLAPLTEQSELTRAVKLEKASGAPEFTSKRESLERDLQRAEAIIDDQRAPDPCVAFHRVQHGTEGPKVRLVWGFPLSMTLVESRFARPLIQWFQHNRTPMAFGFHRHELAARLLRVSNSGVRFGLDFSGFDSSIHPRLIDDAFRILRTHFDLDERMDKAWRKVVWYFIHTPILMPDGFVYQKHHGVPSGSYFTQLVDSVVNFLAIQYASIKVFGKPIEEGKLMVLGDDSVFGVDRYLRLEGLKSLFSDLGLKMNVEKSDVSKFPHSFQFLGHAWSKGTVNRPVEDIAKRMAFPERVSVIDDPRERIQLRMFSYLADSLSAWAVVRRWSRYKGNDVHATLARGIVGSPVTGWQEFTMMNDLGHWYLSDTSRLAYLGLLT